MHAPNIKGINLTRCGFTLLHKTIDCSFHFDIKTLGYNRPNSHLIKYLFSHVNNCGIFYIIQMNELQCLFTFIHIHFSERLSISSAQPACNYCKPPLESSVLLACRCFPPLASFLWSRP